MLCHFGRQCHNIVQFFWYFLIGSLYHSLIETLDNCLPLVAHSYIFVKRCFPFSLVVAYALQNLCLT